MFFFFKQKTAYEMRISDWSSDVCSSDLADKVHPIDSPDHVVFGGFDGDATAYSLMAAGTLDADGVQDLFYEAELAVNAQIGRASCRARVCQSVSISVVAVSLKKHNPNIRIV